MCCLFPQVRGSARSILVAERIALNFMQRMSGIATATHQMVQVRGEREQRMVCDEFRTGKGMSEGVGAGYEHGVQGRGTRARAGGPGGGGAGGGRGAYPDSCTMPEEA